MFKRLNYLWSLLFLTACGGTSNTNIDSTQVVKDTLAYTYTTYRAHSQYFVGNDEVIDTTYFEIMYPQFTDNTINENLKRFILIDGENSAAEAATSFIDGFEEFVGDSSLELISTAWSKDINSNIVLNTPILLSMVTQINEYSGGAHGQHYSMYSNFDIRRKKPISLSDIIQTSKKSDFIQIAEQHFRKQENIAKDDSLDKDFFFPDGKFTINDNFGFTKNSLIIYYNEYEIKPYSEGPTKLAIPYQALNNVLNIRGHEYIQSIL